MARLNFYIVFTSHSPNKVQGESSRVRLTLENLPDGADFPTEAEAVFAAQRLADKAAPQWVGIYSVAQEYVV